jgi:hypothetical protein
LSSERQDRHDDEDTRYFEVDFDLSEAFSFKRPTDAVMETIREMMESLPVRADIRDPAGLDTLQNVATVGSIDEIIRVLKQVLQADYHENTRELKELADFRTYVIETDMHPDALDIVTELSDKTEPSRAILYGSRVRRIDDGRYALWSGHA